MADHFADIEDLLHTDSDEEVPEPGLMPVMPALADSDYSDGNDESSDDGDVLEAPDVHQEDFGPHDLPHHVVRAYVYSPKREVTLVVEKLGGEIIPQEYQWAERGNCWPLRTAITFLCPEARFSVDIHLGKRMVQKVELEPGYNIFSADWCHLYLNPGGHTNVDNTPGDPYNVRTNLVSVGNLDSTWTLLPEFSPDGVVIEYDPLDYAERWRSNSFPHKIIMVSRENDPHRWRSFCPIGMHEETLRRLVKANFCPLRPALQRITYYDLWTHFRWIHPLDMMSMIRRPAIFRSD